MALVGIRGQHPEIPSTVRGANDLVDGSQARVGGVVVVNKRGSM